MKTFFSILLIAVVLTACNQGQPTQPTQSQQEGEVRFHGPLIENFDAPTSDYFNPNPLRGDRAGEFDFRYFSGVPSFSEKGTTIMIYRIDPDGPAGAGRGPEIVSKDFTHFGSYAVRLKAPDMSRVQPNIGLVIGYFTYNVDPVHGQSEIDWEWLLADPEIIHLGTWTGVRPHYNRVGRSINMATGTIFGTTWREGTLEGGVRGTVASGAFTDENCQPETIQPIEGYNASSQFYTYGFDWYPDRMVWWMLHPTTDEKIILWDYPGTIDVFPGQRSPNGIPPNPSKYRLNYWHTNDWPVRGNPNSIERPNYPYELEIDWMSYTPFEELNKAYQEQNK